MSRQRLLTIGLIGVVFLVALRVAIGWHFLYEGISKYNNPTFTSAGYLRQAKGPLKDFYQGMLPDFYQFDAVMAAADPAPATGHQEWHDRLFGDWGSHRTRFAAFYDFDEEQIAKSQEILSDHTQNPTKVDGHLLKFDKAIRAYFRERQRLSDQQDEADSDPRRAQIQDQLDALERRADAEWRGKVAAYRRNFERMLPSLLTGVQKARGDFPAAASYDPWAKNILAGWWGHYNAADNFYRYSDEQRTAAKRLLAEKKIKLWNFLGTERERPESVLGPELGYDSPGLEDYRVALRKLAAARAAPGADEIPFQRKRLLDEQRKLDSAARKWKGWVKAEEELLINGLWNLADEEQQKRGAVPRGEGPLAGQDLLVTYGLIAIGFCLIIGLFTRLAAVGGAVFLAMVALAQIPMPGAYPPPPLAAGSLLYISKEMIEMIAVAFLATTAVGRWAGVDFFLHALFTGRCCTPDGDCTPDKVGTPNGAERPKGSNDES